MKKSWIAVLCILVILLVGYKLFDKPEDVITPVVVEPTPAPNPEPTPAPETPVALEPTLFHLYFPYDTGTDFLLKEVTAMVIVAENETPLEHLSELLKAPTSEDAEALVPVFGPDVEILSVEVLDQGQIKVNVNRAFITQMNAGAALEGSIIQAFANSVAKVYGATGVYLRVEGQPYESGHFYFPEDEVIPVK